MDALDESWVERKLLTASNTQESVQSLSMWALHHKTQHERIVAIWFRVLKGAKLDLRLTLFYLCNEVVQTCRRRHAVVYKDAFKEVLRDAALLVRDVSIRPNIERIFKIWAERGVYDAEFVDELLVLLNNAKVKTAMSTKLLADFTPNRLMDQLMSCSQLEDAVEEQRQALANVDVNALDIDSFKQQLKDRNQGIEYAEELEAACRQIKSYVNNLETEMKERAALVELLEQSQLYYDAQSSEANVVAMAYKTFGSRVTVVQKKLQEHPALANASVSSQDSASNQDYDDRQYQVASTDNSTPRSYDGSEDSNSPLQFFNPADYFDEPINDEDIFLFPSDNKTTSDAPRRLSTESTPGRISKMEPSRRTPSTEHVLRTSPEPFDLFPSEPFRSGSELEIAHRLSPTEMMPAREISSKRNSAEPSHWMPPTDHMPAKERNSRTSSAEHSSSVSPSDSTLPRERSIRKSSVERPQNMSSNDRGPVRERSSRTPSAEHSHRMSPTERANLLFPKDSFHRTISSDLSLNIDFKVSSELDDDAEPIHKRSKIDSSHGHYVSSVESTPKIANMESSRRQSSKDSLRKLSTESETSNRNRRYSYSSSSSSITPQHTTPQRTRSKDSIGSDNYVQPTLSFLPRNIASLGSQKHPPDLSNLFPNSEIGHGGATPTRDEEGGATPVLDEPDDDDVNYSSPLDQTSGAYKPANSYMQLPKQTNTKGSSDHNAHLERQSYSTGSDVCSDVTSGYDKVKSNTQYIADLDQTRSRAVDSSRSASVLYSGDVSERYRPTAESYHSQDVFHPKDQDYHPSRAAVTLPGYHQSSAGAPLQSAPASAVDNFQAVLPVDLPPPVTYYPVLMDQYSNSSYNDTPKPQIYQQPPPDFSHPPPAIYNPSLPPPGMSVSSISLVPQQNLQPPSASPSYTLPPPLPPHSGAMVLQQPGALVNSAPPPRVVQITVLPSHVDVFNAPQLPTSSHLPSMLPATSVYSTQLAAPPRRIEHIAPTGDYNNDLPPSGGYITTIGGNGDSRRNTYSHTELSQTQPIRSITSSRRNDRDYNVDTRITNAPTLSSNKGHGLTSMPEERFDYLVHTGHVVYDNNATGVARTEQEAHHIPTLGYNVHNDHRGQRTVRGSQSTPHSQPPWS